MIFFLKNVPSFHLWMGDRLPLVDVFYVSMFNKLWTNMFTKWILFMG